ARPQDGQAAARRAPAAVGDDRTAHGSLHPERCLLLRRGRGRRHREVARRQRLPIAVEKADTRAVARAEKISIEMAARKVRHEFLARVARKRGMGVIALAHHADDQVELFFLRLMRGAGSDGIAGMKWRNASPADKKIGW